MKEHYLPWNEPSSFKAGLSFVHEDKSFSLERNFLNDEVTLIEDKKKFQAKISPQGRRSERDIYFKKVQDYFGLSDPLLFRKTIFIGQNELLRKWTEEENVQLKSLLSGLSEHDYDQILNELEVKYFQLTKSAPNGMNKRNNRLLEEIQEQKKQLEAQLQISKETYENIESIKHKSSVLQEETTHLKKESKFLESLLPHISKFKNLLDKKNLLSKQYEEKNKLKNKSAQLSLQYQLLEEQSRLDKRIFFLPLVSLVFVWWWPVALSLLVATGAILTYVVMAQRKILNQKKDCSHQRAYLPTQTSLEKDLSEVAGQLHEIKSEIVEICTRYPKLSKIDDVKDCDILFYENQKIFTSHQKKIEEKTFAMFQIEKNMALSQKGITPPSKLLDDISILEEQEKSVKAKTQGLYWAHKILMESIQEYRQSFLETLSEDVSHLFSHITQKHPHVSILKDFQLKLKNDAQEFSSSHLSFGAKEQLYFALRLVFIQKLTHNKSLPLFLDDPFVNFDEHRLKSSCDLIEKYAQNHQVFFVTHSQSMINYFPKAHLISL